MFKKLLALVLACVVTGASIGAPMALASTTQPVVSLDSSQKIHPLLQYAAKADPNREVRVIVQKTNFAALGGGGLLGSLLGPGVPGLQIIEDFSVIPASLATLPASSLPALAGLANVRYVSPDGAVTFNPGLLPLVTNLLSPVVNLLGGLLGTSSTTSSSPAPRQIPPTTSQVSSRNLQTIYPIETGASMAWSGADGHVETGSGIGVAVIDTGLDLTHADLAGRSIAVSVNKSTSSTADGYGHGTHVGGIVNSLSPGQQYVGIAPDATLIGVKVADDNGAAYESDLLRGLQWVDQNRSTYHIRVVNLSVSTGVPSSYATSPIDAAVERLWYDGVTVVAAAGNYGADLDAVWYAPANDPLVITVGCLDDNQTLTPNDDSLCPISSRGITEDGFAKPDLVAPGRKIVSALSSGANGKPSVLAGQFPDRITSDGRHIRMSGTSMSAPIVSGALALLLQRHPQLTPNQLKQVLVQSAAAYPGQADRAGELNIEMALLLSDEPPANSPQVLVPVGGVAAPGGSVTLLWDGSRWSTTYWDGSRWSNAYWDGSRWSGSMEWDGSRWTSAYWDGSRWSSTYWDGSRWSNAPWDSAQNYY
jgi:serine protease AprX